MPGNKEGVPVKSARAPRWKCVATVPAVHSRTIYSVDWSTTNLIASAGADNSIKIMQFVSGNYESLYEYYNFIKRVIILIPIL